MERRAFMLLTGASLVVAPSALRATGGFDVGNSARQHDVRVLLANAPFAEPRPLDGWHFAWSGRSYRGTFSTVEFGDGRSGLINLVPLDAYLYGVLSKEVSALWAPGAQQAQAIVSRTYVLGKLRPAQPYDVLASESDQLYGGIESETVEGRAAIDATGGVVVTYASAPARVVFSACCGGRTADAGNVWNTPYPYLPSIVDPNCVGTPAYAWQIDVALDLLKTKLGVPFTRIGALESVQLGESDRGARPTSIAFVGATSTFEITPKAFRASLGASVVRSTFVRTISVQNKTSSVAIAGTGRGHGVGLCQWGARVLGDRGASASDIIAFYFPGTALARA